MALKDKLTQGGSSLTAFNGKTPSINPLATDASKMHNQYSINNSNKSLVNSQYQQYLDGTPNILPSPSQLDINGIEPTTALKANGVPSINNTFGKGKYEDYVLQTKQFQDRVDDITG